MLLLFRRCNAAAVHAAHSAAIHRCPFHFSWDEWVPENRVLKYNEANVQKQKEVSKLHVSLTNKNKKGELHSTGAAIDCFDSLMNASLLVL